MINEILKSQTKFVRSSVPQDLHFDQYENNMTIHDNAVGDSECPQLTDARPVTVQSNTIKNEHFCDSLLISSVEESRTNGTEKNPELIVTTEQPIQISSDEGNEDALYAFRKKKCKRHKFNKPKKRVNI